MATKTETLINELKINYFKTEELYQEALVNNEINENEIYMTPENNETQMQLDGHISDTDNPHGVNLTQLGITVSADELNHVDGVTSNIQEQLNGKAPTSHGSHVTFTTTTPKMNGTASVGTATTVSRSDHVHPTDTSRAAASHTHDGYLESNKIAIIEGTVTVTSSNYTFTYDFPTGFTYKNSIIIGKMNGGGTTGALLNENTPTVTFTTDGKIQVAFSNSSSSSLTYHFVVVLYRYL